MLARNYRSRCLRDGSDLFIREDIKGRKIGFDFFLAFFN